MKTQKAIYMDDGAPVSGVLVERFLRKPVFIASDTHCGWNKQIITKNESKNLVLLYGPPRPAKTKNFVIEPHHVIDIQKK